MQQLWRSQASKPGRSNLMVHNVKILPEFFNKVFSGIKTFESRINDRNYQPGDLLIMNEFSNGVYTGRKIESVITDVYEGEHCKDGYCIISFRLLSSAVKIPITVYIELYRLYCSACNERDSLRSEVRL